MLETQTRTEQRDGTVVVSIAGALEHASTGDLHAELDAALATAVGAALVLDLSGVTFCDSSGLGVLMAVYNRAAARGVPLALALVPVALRRLLQVTSLDQVFAVYDTVEDAAAQRQSP